MSEPGPDMEMDEVSKSYAWVVEDPATRLQQQVAGTFPNHVWTKKR